MKAHLLGMVVLVAVTLFTPRIAVGQDLTTRYVFAGPLVNADSQPPVIWGGGGGVERLACCTGGRSGRMPWRVIGRRIVHHAVGCAVCLAFQRVVGGGEWQRRRRPPQMTLQRLVTRPWIGRPPAGRRMPRAAGGFAQSLRSNTHLHQMPPANRAASPWGKDCSRAACLKPTGATLPDNAIAPAADAAI